MYRIKSIQFKDHPILKNLALDFCDAEGNAVDTIIFAGENGTGKSTLINELYKVASHTADREMDVFITDGSRTVTLNYYLKHFPNRNPAYSLYVRDGAGMNTYSTSDDIKHRYPFSGVFSDVDINFHAKDISTVTSLTLDATKNSRRSSSDLPTSIKQLLIDVQAMDDGDVARAARKNPDAGLNKLVVEERMPRFIQAFNRMFSDLTYSHVENVRGHKVIVFNKCGHSVSIDTLSSGEKQVVYRGCFLLRDVNATNGAFVFIDEPEISLHPMWQMKIMEYYKGIFTNETGEQTSQIFAVTHSPFVIHNDNRRNDKVIVLARNENGDIVVNDKPEYFKCNTVEAVQDAFSISSSVTEKSNVFLEGRTDEKYFKKAAEVFGFADLPFDFHWVGHMKNSKDEEFTGKDSLNKASQFLIGRNLAVKNVCLYDCDTKRTEACKNNVYTRVIPTYTSSKRMKVGIENALVLDKIELSPFYSTEIKEGNYGDNNTIVEFKKMEFCDYICSLDEQTQREVLANLKPVIESLVSLIKGE